MRQLKTIVFIGLLTIGCQKFEHNDLSGSACTFCDYAKSLEGEYRGYIGSVYPQISDSVTVTIEQVFVGQSSVQDSLVIQLKMTYVPDNQNAIIDTIRIVDNSGLTLDYSKDDPIKFRDYVFSISHESMYFSHYFKANHSYVPYLAGTLYKQ